MDRTTVDVLPVLAVLGANASGKSNLLRAMDFMRDLVLESAQRPPMEGMPIDPFVLDPNYRQRPTLMEIDFTMQGERFQYGFEIDANRVIGEWLHTFPHKRTQVLFDRDENEDYQWGKNLPPRTRTVAGLTRPDVLFLSMAANLNNELMLRIYSFFRDNLILLDVPNRGHVSPPTVRRLQGKRRKSIDMLALADLGIVDAKVTKTRLSEEQRQHYRKYIEESWNLTPGATEDERAAEIEEVLLNIEKSQNDSNPVVEMIHRGPENRAISLPYNEESLGTKSWLSFSTYALDALENGSVLLVDELDASLHPILLREAIELFQSTANTRGAQLIFTTHDVTLLGRDLDGHSLSRGQIWMVEKNSGGDSTLVPLSDYKPRKGEDLARGYLQGRYGGTPRIARSTVARAAVGVGTDGDA
ncbi:AAA family ATPase [Rhodococcus sp. NBC_00297]|uniref:AAA family ATPase n=1 Tax=Rhodococcus sp. NBC_00297 TaxID=2976005 RepID=UPI002E2A6300|nr:ATP-binding protein [Rhodococcus sp. NBC_00297]